MDFCSEKLVQLVILTIKILSLHQSCLLKFSLFAHGTLERHQDVFLSGEYCCHETSCERAHSPQISCLKVSSSILSYGNDLQHIAVVDSDSQALHINSTALSLGFMKLTNTLSFLQTCTCIWPKYPKMTFYTGLSLGWLHFCKPNKSGRCCYTRCTFVTMDLSGMLMFTDLNEHETCIAVFD